MAYDVGGRMIRRVDGYLGGTATALGQNSAAHQQCSGSGGEVSSWVYHRSGAATGQLDFVASPDYRQAYTYDSLGRVKNTVTTIKGQAFHMATSYDRYSRPQTVTYPQAGGPSRCPVQTNS